MLELLDQREGELRKFVAKMKNLVNLRGEKKMRTNDEINKELVVQNGDGVRRLQLEVLMDVRALLQTLVANTTPAVAQPVQPKATTKATTSKKK